MASLARKKEVRNCGYSRREATAILGSWKELTLDLYKKKVF